MSQRGTAGGNRRKPQGARGLGEQGGRRCRELQRDRRRRVGDRVPVPLGDHGPGEARHLVAVLEPVDASFGAGPVGLGTKSIPIEVQTTNANRPLLCQAKRVTQNSTQYLLKTVVNLPQLSLMECFLRAACENGFFG